MADSVAREDVLPALSKADVLAIHRYMTLTHLIDERMWQLNRMGKAPKVVGFCGHEASAVGIGFAVLKEVDWAVPYYRDLGVALVLGQSVLDQFLSLFSKADDPNSGGRQIHGMFGDKRLNILTTSSSVGTQFPHAVGLALALRNRGIPGVAWVCAGEGGTSTGDFHESMNFAAIHKLPVVFVIENNGYAISVPQKLQMPVAHVVDRASAYDMPGYLADGMDVLDVLAWGRAARRHAAAGLGPVLVECVTRRLTPHTSDDDDAYRAGPDVEAWRAEHPVERFADVILARGLATSDELQRSGAEAQLEVDRAIEEAETHPDPMPADMSTNVYGD